MKSNQSPGRNHDRGGKGRNGSGSGLLGRRRQNAGIGQAGAPDELCTCSMCRHQEVHQRGLPCITQICPKCGGAMTRQYQEVQHARR